MQIAAEINFKLSIKNAGSNEKINNGRVEELTDYKIEAGVNKETKKIIKVLSRPSFSRSISIREKIIKRR